MVRGTRKLSFPQLFKSFEFFCAIAVLVMMGLIVAEITLRALGIGHIPACDEFVQNLVVLSIYFGVAPLQQRKGHIRVKFLIDRLFEKYMPLADAFAWVSFLAFFLIVLWQGYGMAIESFTSGERFTMIPLPVYPIRIGLVVGCFFMVLQLLIDIVFSCKEFLKWR